MKTIISLCDLTGNFVRPWVAEGYRAILVDPQHEVTTHGKITRLACTVEEALPSIRELIRGDCIAVVAAFPPCTDLAVSGARWFESKREADPLFQAKAIAVAEQCRMVGELSGAPYFVENPISVLSSAWGKPDHAFDPCDYTAWEIGDNYTKRTCLWTGNGFKMPPAHTDKALGPPDDRIHKAPPGPDRANFRSATPMGFARAVFEANK